MPLLIRHTTPLVAPGICYGWSDVDVTQSFQEEAKTILDAIPPNIERIYSSPLQRCAKLATFIANHSAHTNIHYVDALKEMHFGNWEMQAWDNIDKTALATWMENYVVATVPGGESFTELNARVADWYLTHLSLLTNAVIVTHAGPIRCMLSMVNNSPLAHAFSLYKVAYGQIFSV